jgi:hypothetical protein
MIFKKYYPFNESFKQYGKPSTKRRAQRFVNERNTYKGGHWVLHTKEQYKLFMKNPTNKEEPTCPKCGAEEIDHNSPHTKYSCGSTDYDQRPGTFKKGDMCKW